MRRGPKGFWLLALPLAATMGYAGARGRASSAIDQPIDSGSGIELASLDRTVEPRTNGVVSNMPEFQKAFSCSATAKMVKTPVCRVW